MERQQGRGVADGHGGGDDPWRFAIDRAALEKQRLHFKRLKDRVKRYFEMQFKYQMEMSTLDSLCRHLPQFYRTKLLHTLFQRAFKQHGPVQRTLYSNKDLYFRLLTHLQEQIYTAWDDAVFDFIIDPQQPAVRDLLMIQSGRCEVYRRKDWIRKLEGVTVEPRYKTVGHLIGFKSLVTGKRSDCVIRPEAVSQDGAEKYRIVSILKVPEEKWELVWSEAFDDEERRAQFVHDVLEDDFFDDWKGAMTLRRPMAVTEHPKEKSESAGSTAM